MNNNSIINEYKKHLAPNSNVNSKNVNINDSTKQSNNTSNFDYTKMASQQEYSALLDKEIELENAKQNALKYTNNQMAAQGFDRQGYGSSQMASIQNQYNNALAQEKRDFNDAMINKSNERFGYIMDMMDDAQGDMSLINDLLTDYGYGQINEKDGSFVFGSKPENMTEDDWYRLRYAYNLNQNLSKENETNNSSMYFKDINSFIESASYKNGDKTEFIFDNFKYETIQLQENIKNNTYEPGTVIMLQNVDGERVYVKVSDDNGLYIVSEKDYVKASNENKSDYLIWDKNVNKGSFMNLIMEQNKKN